MLSGKELGQAIKLAIEKKISSGAVKTKADIARHFKIKPPSIHDWIKKGSISKDKLPELWNYFSDVAGPEHWGLVEFPAYTQVVDGAEQVVEGNHIHRAYSKATAERRAVVDYLLSIETHEPGWVDSDARAYVSTLENKARQWIGSDQTVRPSGNQSKTGS